MTEPEITTESNQEYVEKTFNLKEQERQIRKSVTIYKNSCDEKRRFAADY